MYSTAVLKIDSASKIRANWLKISRNPAIFGQNSANFRQFTHTNFNLFHYAGNNPVRYTDPTGAFDFDDVKTFCSDVWKNITYFHFEGRDAKNIITESFNEIKDSADNGGDWTLLPESMSVYHQNGIGDPELKFVCKDGREAVFSKDNSPDGSYQLVTDPRYKGTYNYCNPASPPTLPNGVTDFKGIGDCVSESLQFAVKGVGHLFADMIPYYVTGCKNERNQ